MGNVRRIAACVGALCVLMTCSAAGAEPGDLDPSFGAKGIGLQPGAAGQAMVRDGAGNIVVVGSAAGGGFVVARFKPDGTPDTSFGSFGPTPGRISQAGTGGSAYAGAIDSQGRNRVAGASQTKPGETGFAVGRFLSDGHFDPAFNGAAIAVVGIGDAGDANGNGVVIQSGDAIAVAGDADTLAGGYEFALQRFKPDGS